MDFKNKDEKYYQNIRNYLIHRAHAVQVDANLNRLSLAGLSEDFYAAFLNILLDLQLENANATERNKAGIDLIDWKNRVAAQVSVTCAPKTIREKIRSSIKKFDKPEDGTWQFYFVPITDIAPDLSKGFELPEGLIFDHTKDVLDITRIMELAKGIEKLRLLSWLVDQYNEDEQDMQELRDSHDRMNYTMRKDSSATDSSYVDSDTIRWMLPDWVPLFTNCSDMETLLLCALHSICSITKTDYNQIVLLARRNDYDSSLWVFADNVIDHKQRYRIVNMDGIMGEVFESGKQIILDNVMEYHKYYPAVPETKSEAVIPIIIEGNTIGLINSESESRGYYSYQIKKELNNVALNLAIALNRIGYKKNMPYSAIPYVHISGMKIQ